MWELHSLHYEKYTEISIADNLQINTEQGREDVYLFVRSGKYYQNTYFETIKRRVCFTSCLPVLEHKYTKTSSPSPDSLLLHVLLLLHLLQPPSSRGTHLSQSPTFGLCPRPDPQHFRCHQCALSYALPLFFLAPPLWAASAGLGTTCAAAGGVLRGAVAAFCWLTVTAVGQVFICCPRSD